MRRRIIRYFCSEHEDEFALLEPGRIMIIAIKTLTLCSFIKMIIGAEDILKCLPKGPHDWRRVFWPDEVHCAHILDFSELIGVSFYPVTSHWCLSGDTIVNYMPPVTERS